MRELTQGDPSGVLGLVIRISLNGDGPGNVTHQVVVDNLVDPPIYAGKPIIDRGEVANDAPVNTSFFSDFAKSGFFGRLQAFKMPLREAPLNLPRAIPSGDDRCVGLAIANIDNDAPGRSLRGNGKEMRGRIRCTQRRMTTRRLRHSGS